MKVDGRLKFIKDAEAEDYQNLVSSCQRLFSKLQTKLGIAAANEVLSVIGKKMKPYIKMY